MSLNSFPNPKRSFHVECIKGMFTLKASCHGSQMTMVPGFLDESIGKFGGYSPRSFEGHKPVLKTQTPAANPIRSTSKDVSKALLVFPTNTSHTCHVGFHVNFPSTTNIKSCSPKLHSFKPKTEGP